MADLSFIIVGESVLPDADQVVASAREMGISLSSGELSTLHENDSDGPDVLSFEGENGDSLLVALMPAPHPDVEKMPRGPLSPDDYENLIDAPAHLIVTRVGVGEDADVDDRDIQMSALTAAVASACPALGVLKMPGVLFHRPGLFIDAAKAGIENEMIPVLVCIDITVAMESDQQISILSHNMQRYGREELYIKAPSGGKGAIGFAMDIIHWLVVDREYELPTGDTIGRNEDEKINIERTAHPFGEGPEVILLNLPETLEDGSE
ncbi:MAG: hypothetical protein AAFN77_05255 [Planctomycetota bacterium]